MFSSIVWVHAKSEKKNQTKQQKSKVFFNPLFTPHFQGLLSC